MGQTYHHNKLQLLQWALLLLRSYQIEQSELIVRANNMIYCGEYQHKDLQTWNSLYRIINLWRQLLIV